MLRGFICLFKNPSPSVGLWYYLGERRDEVIHVCTAQGRKEVVSLATASMFWLPLAKLEYIEISALGVSLAKGEKIAGKSPQPSFAKPNHPFLSQRKMKAAITEGSTSPKDKPPSHTVFLHHCPTAFQTYTAQQIRLQKSTHMCLKWRMALRKIDQKMSSADQLKPLTIRR